MSHERYVMVFITYIMKFGKREDGLKEMSSVSTEGTWVNESTRLPLIYLSIINIYSKIYKESDE